MVKKIDLVGVVTWIVGFLVTLAVGFGMIGSVLLIPKIPEVVTIIAGWIVVIVAIIGGILLGVKRFT